MLGHQILQSRNYEKGPPWLDQTTVQGRGAAPRNAATGHSTERGGPIKSAPSSGMLCTQLEGMHMQACEEKDNSDTKP